MLITKSVEVIINSSNLKHYKELGYKNIKVKEKIHIDINELTKGSYVIVDAECDVCHNTKKIEYHRYLDNIEKYNIFSCSRKCANIKRIKTNIEKYGVEYPIQNEEIKQKRKETELERYGFVHHLKNKDILNKQKNTNLSRYGNECSLLNDEVKLKTIKTNIERYNVDIPLKNKSVINKLIDTNNLKYNNNSPLQSENIRKKSLITLFQNFGVYNPMKSEIIKNKVKVTKIFNLINKYKKLDIININYEKQEYEFLCEQDHHFFISSVLLYNRLKTKTILCTICNPINSYTNSGYENQLYNYIKENYNNDIVLNSRNIISPNELDIYLPDLKIAFEFNGVYWHNEINKINGYHQMKDVKKKVFI